MKNWVVRQLRVDGAGTLVIIDPDGVLTDSDLDESDDGPIARVRVRGWFELRRAWEHHGRRRPPTDPRLVLIVQDPAVVSSADLPFDIEQSSLVRRIRIPGPAATNAVVRSLADELSDRAVERLEAGDLDPIDAVLTAAAGTPALALSASGSGQFQLALRLSDHPQPPEVLHLARGVFTDPLALAMLATPVAPDQVSAAWQDWINDPTGSVWSSHMNDCRAELMDMFITGRLAPATSGAADVPRWATIGIAKTSPARQAADLLDSPPGPATSLDEWVRTAQWWGEVRSCLARVNPPEPDLEARAWEWWADTDERFLAWLRASYGSQLTRTWANWPASLDKVQPYLTKRQKAAGRVLLVVLDGMGFTQWARIRELAGVRVVQAGGVLAMLPTLTEVSRQAIAAGTVPTQFADSIRSTSKEPLRWATAWSDSGASTAWVRIDGVRVEELNAVPFGSVDAIGVVLSATDELMHSAELLGDVGLHAAVEAWMGSGVLTELVGRAAESGYETWLTADHGNLAVETTKEIREGDFVERAGTRVRRYASRSLRDDARVDGIAWDTLPGYPAAESERLLFAPGRVGWGPSRLSHGGLSIDEVIVPLVHVEPAS